MHPIAASKPDRSLTGGAVGLCLSVLLFLLSSPAMAQAPSLGSAMRFAVLGATTVTNTGASNVTGDVGVAPGTSITGFPPGIVTGTIHPGDPAAVRAQGDVAIAYNALVSTVCTTPLTGQNLGGLTLTPGVYCFATSAQLTGILTLDAVGNPTAVFVFQIASTLTTATGSSVQLINGASARNVFWQVGSSATLGTATAFAGNLIALTSITLSAGTFVSGSALAQTGAVTMDTSSVVLPTSTCPASWNNYGTGWPGTGNVVPSLVLSALPVLGTTTDLVVQNVRGQATFGILLWGTGPVNIPTVLGGSFQVMAIRQWTTAMIAPGLFSIPMSIPLDPRLACMSADLQVLQLDEGASNLVAFTRGLHMVLGQ